MRPTKSTQDKLQHILESQGFTVRYEKGHFKAGHCVVLHQKTVIINKFLPIEGIIQTLSEILKEIELDLSQLDEEQIKYVEKNIRTSA